MRERGGGRKGGREFKPYAHEVRENHAHGSITQMATHASAMGRRENGRLWKNACNGKANVYRQRGVEGDVREV